jgi:hypothetical protein
VRDDVDHHTEPLAERLPDAWLAAADYLGLVLLTIRF